VWPMMCVSDMSMGCRQVCLCCATSPERNLVAGVSAGEECLLCHCHPRTLCFWWADAERHVVADMWVCVGCLACRVWAVA
jgi:hypothetical protein